MDSLERAEKYLKKKYKKTQSVCEDIGVGYVLSVYEVMQDGTETFKVLYHKNHKETIIYTLTPEQIIE